jgi:hypothetical protein
MRHRLDGLEPATTFRCERCGQKLLVPSVTTVASPSAARAVDAGAAVMPPPRRRSDGSGSGTGAAAAAGVAVTLPASGTPPPATPDVARARSGRPAERPRVRWYWRLLAWIVAVPLGFVIAVVPSYEFGLISKDDVFDAFFGSGTDRYVRLGIVTLIWAVVTAVLVQVFIEVGRAMANRRRRHAPAPRRGDSQVPAVSS